MTNAQAGTAYYRAMNANAPRSRKLSAVSDAAERLYWRMLAATDPYGTLPGDPVDVKIACFPGTKHTADDCRRLTGQLAKAGLVETWSEDDGTTWVHLIGFDRFQPYEFRRKRRDRRSPVPPSQRWTPPGKDAPAVETPPVTVDEPDDAPAADETPDPVNEVFDFWVAETKRDPARYRLTADRRTRIAARLKDGYSVDDLKSSIRGYATDPFHSGQNNRGRRYDDIPTILKSGAKVDAGIEIDQGNAKRKRATGEGYGASDAEA